LLIVSSLEIGTVFEMLGVWSAAFDEYRESMTFEESSEAMYKCALVQLWGFNVCEIDEKSASQLLFAAGEYGSHEAKSLYTACLVHHVGIPPSVASINQAGFIHVSLPFTRSEFGIAF
jgi:hypothetical protein